MAVLVTGGAGYIGSHTLVALLSAGYEVVVMDNLTNSSALSVDRVSVISGNRLAFERSDVRDSAALDDLFNRYDITAVLHFAGLKAVGESLEDPLTYFDTNVGGSITLLKAMTRAGVFKLVFSSSATVYGQPSQLPITENTPVGEITNPYGRSKLMVEKILSDLVESDERWSIAALRYFNPVGAHESGLIGEDPSGIPNNLVPYIGQVAIGRRDYIPVFGDDYETVDGTGVRDYIHVMDLAEGHVKALQALNSKSGMNIWNLGTGVGYSVLQMVNAFETVIGNALPYRCLPRRPGDVAACWSDPSKAKREIGWQAERNLTDMVRDTWRWQVKNPDGYRNDPKDTADQ